MDLTQRTQRRRRHREEREPVKARNSLTKASVEKKERTLKVRHCKESMNG